MADVTLSPGFDIPGADLLPYLLYGTVPELAAACAANASCVAFTSTGRRGALKGGAFLNRTALLSASATPAPTCTYIKYTGASCAACVHGLSVASDMYGPCATRYCRHVEYAIFKPSCAQCRETNKLCIVAQPCKPGVPHLLCVPCFCVPFNTAQARMAPRVRPSAALSPYPEW